MVLNFCLGFSITQPMLLLASLVHLFVRSAQFYHSLHFRQVEFSPNFGLDLSVPQHVLLLTGLVYLFVFSAQFFLNFLGSGPKREQSPVEFGENPFARPSPPWFSDRL